MTTPRATADIGLVGLAVMGENLVLNMESHGFTVAVFNRTTSQGRRLPRRTRPRARRSSARTRVEELVGRLKRPAQDHDDGQGRASRWTRSSTNWSRCWSRATSSSTAATRTSPTRPAARKYLKDKGTPLHRHRRLRRRGRRAATGPSIMPGGNPGGLAAREADLPGHRRQGRRRHALLRLGRARRRRPLRQDGP